MVLFLWWPYRIFCRIGWHEWTTAYDWKRRTTPRVWTCAVCKKRRGPFRWERE